MMRSIYTVRAIIGKIEKQWRFSPKTLAHARARAEGGETVAVWLHAPGEVIERVVLEDHAVGRVCGGGGSSSSSSSSSSRT
eukprot:COSAG06_NODE_17154_length_958_cov_1.335274_1_plen_81_part_00